MTDHFKIPLVVWRVAAAVLNLALATPACSESVLVVLSGDAEPYRQAAAAVSQSPGLGSHRFATVTLSELTSDDTSRVRDAGVLVGVGSQAANWLKQHLDQRQQLVFCMVADAEGLGLDGHSRIRGVSTDVCLREQFKLIREAMPTAHRAGMLYHSRNARSLRLYQKARAATPEDIDLVAVDLAEHKTAGRAVESLLAGEIDLVWTLPDAAVYDAATTRMLLLYAIRNAKPVFGFSPAFVRAGALLGVGVEPADQGRQAAELVRDVLAGKQEKPVLEPRYVTAVNLIVAEKLSIDLPRPLIERAAHVFRAQ